MSQLRAFRRKLAAATIAATALAIGLWIGREYFPRPAPVPPKEALVLSPASFADLPGWAEDDHAAALSAFRRSCAALDKLPAAAKLADAAQAGSGGEWQAICRAAPEGADGTAARAFFERHFRPHRAAGSEAAEGLLTGYYEPELKGARAQGGRFAVPLYRVPDDLVQIELGAFRDDLKDQTLVGRLANGRLVPYADRAAIDGGALSGRGLELVWLDDAVDAFFLHVQGSGRVALAEGGVLRVGFAAHNGRAFVAVGRKLIEEGKLARDGVSMQAVRDWLRANPDQAPRVMHANPRYVFFREIAGEGPVGAQGVALTAGRSLAVDRRFVPLGVPVWLDTTMPGVPSRLRRLVVAQDTGGAIQGPLRGDLYWGAGEAALEQAGRMRQAARLYLLLPKGAPGI